ncbi:ABC transporter permease [Streptomyces sp. NPDC015492]|uniref:ABC transporter permease n=1 Tax=Streptomyces sp. NPDC015492 TaxID=3364958 RepID=UPI0036F6E6E1
MDEATRTRVPSGGAPGPDGAPAPAPDRAPDRAPADGPRGGRGPRRAPGLWGESWRTYRMVAGMWIRSTMTYRVSFALTLVNSFCATFLDFVVILLMFGQVKGLGGFSFAEVAFLYGTTGTAFGIADLTMGSLQRMGARVRDGSLDTFLMRPAPLLAQVAGDKFALRRFGRVAQGLMVLVWSLCLLDVEWSPLRLLLLPVTVVSGAVIFGAVMVLGASALFWMQDAAEVTNAFTYGGNTLLQYPPTIFAQDLVRGVVYVVPLAFVNWLPALYVLGRPAPAGVPEWMAFASPLVAAVCCGIAGLAWRAGVRAYRSTGS